MLKSLILPTCAAVTLSMVGCATMSNPSTERNLNELQNKNWVGVRLMVPNLLLIQRSKQMFLQFSLIMSV